MTGSQVKGQPDCYLQGDGDFFPKNGIFLQNKIFFYFLFVSLAIALLAILTPVLVVLGYLSHYDILFVPTVVKIK